MDVECGSFAKCCIVSNHEFEKSRHEELRILLKRRNQILYGVIVVIIGLIFNEAFIWTGKRGHPVGLRQFRSTNFGNSETRERPPSITTTILKTNTALETVSNTVTVSDDEAVEEGEDEAEDADWELDNFEIIWGNLNNYQLGTKLGEGVYSEVFSSTDIRNNKTCVAKVLEPVSKRRVKREIKILQDLSSGPNLLKLVDVVRNDTTGQPWIMTEFLNNTYYRALYPTLSDKEVRFYMFQLLRAIEYAHGRNIMHRDIKPHNIMIEHENRKLRLIDWGLSDYYDENYGYTTSVASRFWRAPELLIGYEWYNPSVDMWSFGCMLAAFIYQKEPFFLGRYNDINQLIKISKVLGTDPLQKWLKDYDIQLDETYNNVTATRYKKRSWSSLVTRHNRGLANRDALDLLGRVLVYDHQARLNATQALAHRYFDPVRKDALSHPNTITKWDVQ